MILHCTKCMHEWESTNKDSLCDWCGAKGRVIGKSWFDSMPTLDEAQKVERFINRVLNGG